METFSAFLAIYAGNSPVTSEFSTQRSVMWIFDVFFDLPLNKQLSKQSRGWWFEMPSPPLWRHCSVTKAQPLHAHLLQSEFFNRHSDQQNKGFPRSSVVFTSRGLRTSGFHNVGICQWFEMPWCSCNVYVNEMGYLILSHFLHHYDDVIMGTIASQITRLTSVYSKVYSGADQSKHQSSASLAFVWGIHRGPVNSPHKRPVTRKMFPFDDVIMMLPSPGHCM